MGSTSEAHPQPAPLKRAACFPCFHVVGALEGRRVLVLAGGRGGDTRQCKQRNAAQVVGVDVAPKLVGDHDV